jgi:hypothetical protein
MMAADYERMNSIMREETTIDSGKTIFIHLIKLQYSRVSAVNLRPTRSRGSAKINRFDIKNKLDYTLGVPDDVLSAKFKEAIDNAIKYNIKNGLPIAIYGRDESGDERKAYLLYPDGHKEYV